MNLLNPKVVVFARLPAAVRTPEQGRLGLQIFVLGLCYALIAFMLMSLMAACAARLRDYLQARPNVVRWLNMVPAPSSHPGSGWRLSGHL